MRLWHRAVLERVEPSSLINADHWMISNQLGRIGFAHVRPGGIRPRRNPHQRHQGFRGYAKTRHVRFRGTNPRTFHLSLKEGEFRYHRQRQNLGRFLPTLCREHPLCQSKPSAKARSPCGEARRRRRGTRCQITGRTIVVAAAKPKTWRRGPMGRVPSEVKPWRSYSARARQLVSITSSRTAW